MFKVTKALKAHLDAAHSKPIDGFINNSTYYTNLDYQWITYMQQFVRPCVAYGSGVGDLNNNSTIKSAVGKAMVDGATRLVIGDKVFFEGNDVACAFLSDIWRQAVNFDAFLSRSQRFKFLAGSTPLKLNIDERGIPYPTAVRLDRALLTVDDFGDVISGVFFIGILASLERRGGETLDYWLVEDRHYSEDGKKVIEFKVFSKQGIANAPVLPSPWQKGIPYDNLPKEVKTALRKSGVTRINEEMELPFRDGLGVWLLNRTATNSVVPDSPFGDPLLLGCLDLLWSIDVVFAGSMIDVINGEGKVLVPKMFLQETMKRLQAQNPGTNFLVTTAELDTYGDESFVYIQPNGFDKDKQTPTPIQFDIRAEQYRAMWELYQKEAVVRGGFSPTSIFPHLTPDGSAKTATEVTAEENLTRASVRQAHALDIPVYNKILREVLYQEGLPDDINIVLGDYIGNKMMFDQNVRDNYAAGLIPLETAVQMINNLTYAETQEYIAKIRAEKESEREMTFNSRDYFGEEMNAEEDRGGGESNSPFGQR